MPNMSNMFEHVHADIIIEYGYIPDGHARHVHDRVMDIIIETCRHWTIEPLWRHQYQ